MKLFFSKNLIKIWVTISVLFLILAYYLCFVVPQNISFAYAKNEYCVDKSVLFPDIYKQSGDQSFKLKINGGFKIGSLYLLSNSICVEPVTTPSSGQKMISFSPFNLPVFSNQYVVNVDSMPKVDVSPDQPVSKMKPLAFTLNKPDIIFNYQLEINDKTSKCENDINIVNCDIKTLELKQGEKYPYKLTRSFDETDISDVKDGDISLISPTTVNATSIQVNEQVYSKPKTFKFETNKKVVSATVKLEIINDGIPTIINSTTIVSGNVIEASIENDLERQKNYKLTLDKLESEDGSLLDSPYVIEFSTSGGPKVKNINIGTDSVDANARIIITLDQEISQTQDISKFVNFSGGNATVSHTNNQIILQLHDLPRCGAFSLDVIKGINSQFDIVSNNSWSYSSRISCRSSKIIGYSVQGRPIVAYYYGNGPTTILFTGGIHGTEKSGSHIMMDWIKHLDGNAYKIPAGRQVVIVPSVNPDGLALSTRYNANSVNIGANFASTNWRPDIDGPSGPILGGGGIAAMSEPETQALASLTTSLRPRLEVSYHAQGSLVGANQYGDSLAISNLYATSVGYRSMVGVAEETMGYTITGEYEEWAGEQYNTPAILIELPTANGYFFTAHQSTLWKMVNI